MTDRELLAHVRALTADPRFAPHFRQLVDLRDVTDLQVAASTIREMLRLNPFGAGAWRALVVTKDEVFGMARMSQLLTDESPDELQIFRKLDDALQWLGIADAKEELLLALSQALRFLGWIRPSIAERSVLPPELLLISQWRHMT
ncbi:hypothetical protein AYO43_04275 [Nitrospira sp. SCGC AG-212-E16]|nr:hypothetical protein AYO43_04275 [Nitrospira sp. SCGC AG-212-E16]